MKKKNYKKRTYCTYSIQFPCRHFQTEIKYFALQKRNIIDFQSLNMNTNKLKNNNIDHV